MRGQADAVDIGDGRTALVRWEGVSLLGTDGLIDRGFGADGTASPSGFSGVGAVTVGDTILAYGGGGDMDVARLQLGDGPADADADGIGDESDACPDRYGPRLPDGCPLLSRVVTLALRRPAGVFVAKVSGLPRSACPAARVRLTRTVRGEVASRFVKPLDAGKRRVRFSVHGLLRGRYRAAISDSPAPPAGHCAAAVSNAVQVKRVGGSRAFSAAG